MLIIYRPTENSHILQTNIYGQLNQIQLHDQSNSFLLSKRLNLEKRYMQYNNFNSLSSSGSKEQSERNLINKPGTPSGQEVTDIEISD